MLLVSENQLRGLLELAGDTLSETQEFRVCLKSLCFQDKVTKLPLQETSNVCQKPYWHYDGPHGGLHVVDEAQIKENKATPAIVNQNSINCHINCCGGDIKGSRITVMQCCISATMQ